MKIQIYIYMYVCMHNYVCFFYPQLSKTASYLKPCYFHKHVLVKVRYNIGFVVWRH
jgi:hypothetical protein